MKIILQNRYICGKKDYQQTADGNIYCATIDSCVFVCVFKVFPVGTYCNTLHRRFIPELFDLDKFWSLWGKQLIKSY